MEGIDGEDGKGSMVLLRVLRKVIFSPSFCFAEYSKRIVSSPLIPKVHGRFFSKVIKDLRDALGLGSVFSVGLDLDDDVSSKVGKLFSLAHISILSYVLPR